MPRHILVRNAWVSIETYARQYVGEARQSARCDSTHPLSSHTLPTMFSGKSSKALTSKQNKNLIFQRIRYFIF